MTKEFPCRWRGLTLHYDDETGRLCDATNSRHRFPNYPKRVSHKTLHAFDDLETQVSKMVELAINVANKV